MTDESTHQVLLIIADISGYTEFMVSSETEIEHSQHVITQLIQAIIRQIEIPLELSKLEGDAVFLYAKKDRGDLAPAQVGKITGRKLLMFFDAFHDKLGELHKHGGCACGACSNINALRLKIVAHSGRAHFYRIHQFDELSGGDVILAHRLLKNSTDRDEYILMTEPAYTDIEFPAEIKVEEGCESYQHLGDVKTFVHHPRP